MQFAGSRDAREEREGDKQMRWRSGSTAVLSVGSGRRAGRRAGGVPRPGSRRLDRLDPALLLRGLSVSKILM